MRRIMGRFTPVNGWKGHQRIASGQARRHEGRSRWKSSPTAAPAAVILNRTLNESGGYYLLYSGKSRNLTTASSGRAISKPLILGGSCAPLMPSVRRHFDGRGSS